MNFSNIKTAFVYLFLCISLYSKACPPISTSTIVPQINQIHFAFNLVNDNCLNSSDLPYAVCDNNTGLITFNNPIINFSIQIQKKCTTTVPGVYTRDDTAPDDPARNGCLQPYSNTCYQVIGNCSSDDPTEAAYLPTLHSGDILNCGYWTTNGNFVDENLEVLLITNMGNYSGYTQDKLNIISDIYIFTIKYLATGDVYEIRMRKI